MIEAKAKLKNVRISSKKMRLVADAIRGLEVAPALERLQILFKKSSPVIEKLLRSAVANAMDRFNVKEEDLVIKSIIVNKGADLKRWRPAAFGRAHPFRKHSSHVEITLTTKEGVKATAKDKKKEEIETVDLTKTDKKAPTGTKAEGKSVKQDKKTQAPAQQASAGKSKGNINVKKG
ncbi:50S ribosomal protein L22 [Candidatus Parcubacteria bacterium]|jgi:large subunit ribosomal protein L22|nr:50S ribosomal protein L22 [Candidatus Parcubacteria bacterium]